MEYPIELFFVDIDGCISSPFTSPVWQRMGELRALSEQSYDDPDIPCICLCTGRPAPYAEAVSQWLDIRGEVIFESGAGLLNVDTQAVRYHPDLPMNHKQMTDLVRKRFMQLSKKYSEVQPESTKQIGVGLTCVNTELITTLLSIVKSFVSEHCPELEVHHTDISIEVIWPFANKGAGINWLCSERKLSLDNVAFIGDSSADVSALDNVGIGFAPQNAHQAAKDAASRVTSGAISRGLLEAWRYLINHNRRLRANNRSKLVQDNLRDID